MDSILGSGLAARKADEGIENHARKIDDFGGIVNKVDRQALARSHFFGFGSFDILKSSGIWSFGI